MRFSRKTIGALALCLGLNQAIAGGGQASSTRKDSGLLSNAPAESVGMSADRLAQLSGPIQDYVERGEIPGAVVLVARQGRVVYSKAVGYKVTEPRRETMSLDTVFDMASLTKVVATATSIMILVERGKLSLIDSVATYIPEFGRMGKEQITVEHLLTHRAGLPPDNEIADYIGKTVDPMENIYNLRPVYPPGSRFSYSDVGYIVAAEIVRRVSGQRLDQFARENIYKPLGMQNTRFLPRTDEGVPAPSDETHGYLERVAPTETRDGRRMQGEVHDPRSYALGGVAGHAGLFSTAGDLAIFCQMILNEGQYGGVRILSPYAVKRMVSSIRLPASEMRGIGWDVNTSYSSNRGDLFPVGSYGHTGFTGNSVWIDPWSKTFVILLTDRVYPNGRGSDTRLRTLVASIVGGSITSPPYAPVFTGSASDAGVTEVPRAPVTRLAPAGPLHPVTNGVDVLERDNFKALEGRRIGLITNQTGRDHAGRSTVDVLASAQNLKLVAIFSPEHGLRGAADSYVDNTRDEKTGLPVYSLFGKGQRRPTSDMLSGIDTLVYDIQDVGARFYTYPATCGYAMEVAAQNKMKFVVLDRPDPIGGYEIEGPVAEAEFTTDPNSSFTSYYKIPVRYGLTIGELATLLNAELKIGADLAVIKMEGWRRADYFDGTALTWTNPSPNMRNLNEAVLYPGIGLLETTNISVGRGTDTPFEVVGAPWIDGQKLSEALNRAGLAGVRFVPIRFTPKSSTFSGQECGGVNILITDRSAFHPVAAGIHIAYDLNRLYPGSWKIDDYINLLANRPVLAALKTGKTPQEIESLWQAGLAEFARIRLKYFLY
jgi:uncharacterized protein YbbC (DUF1343 family)/CubicO group peptidase (beta-lactamase class C family)